MTTKNRLQLKKINLFPLDINQVIDLMDYLAEGIYGVDSEGNCTFINSTALHKLGYSVPSDIIGQKMNDIIHHTTYQGEAYAWENSVLYQSLYKKQVCHRSLEWIWRKDGTNFPVEIWSYPCYKNGIAQGAITAFLDTTQRVYNQKELEKSLSRYKALIESTQVVPWEYDIASHRITFISPQVESMFGYKISKWYTKKFWEKNIHPDDRLKVISTCIDNQSQQQTYEIDYRMLKQDGSIFNVRNYISVVTYDGKKIGLRGIFTDITQSKLQEEQLRLAAATFDSSSSILITDARGVIVKANATFIDITHYQEEDLIGKNPRFLRSKKHNKAFYNAMWQDLKSNNRWQGEIWLFHQDGESSLSWLSITAVKNNLGEISNFIAIFTDISEIKSAEAKLRYQTHYDNLTGLANRKLFFIRLKQAITKARNFNHIGALLLLDIDEFKIINESLGHKGGDKLIVDISKRVKLLLSKGDILARTGADEFAILLPDLGGDLVESQNIVIELANVICKGIYNEFKYKSKPIHISGCIGFTMFSFEKVTSNILMSQADAALYRAKAIGQNTVCQFTDEMLELANKKLTIQGELKRAIRLNELELYFQPKVNRAGNLAGFEALVRWNHPIKGMISPCDFIPIAEESGLIIPLGNWVLHTACEIYANWYKKYHNDMPPISINISAQQFHQSSFVDMVLGCLAENGLTPGQLDIEITEEVLIGDIEQTITIMGALQSSGVNFSIDDFGTGYSSLAYLKKLPINFLKIDKSFIMDLPDDKNDAVIAGTIIVMAKHLGLQVIAEGVETQLQLDFLKNKGCHYFQGYFFSRPLNLNEFELKYLSLMSK